MECSWCFHNHSHFCAHFVTCRWHKIMRSHGPAWRRTRRSTLERHPVIHGHVLPRHELLLRCLFIYHVSIYKWMCSMYAYSPFVLEYLLVSSVLNDRSHFQPISQVPTEHATARRARTAALAVEMCCWPSSPTCKTVIFAWLWKQKQFFFHAWDLGTQEYVFCNEFKYLAIKLSKKQSFRELWRDKSAVWVVADWQIKRCNGSMYQWISYSNINTPQNIEKLDTWKYGGNIELNIPGTVCGIFLRYTESGASYKVESPTPYPLVN